MIDPMDDRFKQILTLVVTWLGILAPLPSAFSSFTPGGAADTYGLEPLVTPAPYAFIIWLPIYLGLLALAVYQALPAHEQEPRFRALRPWLGLSAILNAFWLSAVARGDIWLPVLTIFAMLIAAVALRHALGFAGTDTGLLRWLAASVSLYVGWLTVATVVNTSSALLLSGFTAAPVFWAVLMLIVAALIGLVLQRAWRDAVYGGVFLWSFIAIAVEQWTEGQALIVVVCMVLAVVFAVSLIPRRLRG